MTLSIATHLTLIHCNSPHLSTTLIREAACPAVLIKQVRILSVCASHGFFVQGRRLPPCKHSLEPDISELQVFTIFLAVYKHFMEAIDAIDNGKA